MAQLAHATIDVVMVLVSSAISTRSTGAYASPNVREAAEQEIKLILSEAQASCEANSVEVKTHSLFGNAVKEILLHGDSCRADIII